MDPLLLVLLAGAGVLVFLRRFSARRVAARQGRFVWLMFAPSLLGAAASLWAGTQAFMSAEPLLGLTLGIGGTVYGAMLVRFLTRLSRAASSAGPREEIEAASSEIFIEHTLTMLGLLLIGSLIAVVGLIVWAVASQAH